MESPDRFFQKTVAFIPAFRRAFDALTGWKSVRRGAERRDLRIKPLWIYFPTPMEHGKEKK